MIDERWTRTIMDWRQHTKRLVGIPPERWTNNIKRTADAKLAARGNGSYKMEGDMGGLHPAVDINRLNKRKYN